MTRCSIAGRRCVHSSHVAVWLLLVSIACQGAAFGADETKLSGNGPVPILEDVIADVENQEQSIANLEVRLHQHFVPNDPDGTIQWSVTEQIQQQHWITSDNRLRFDETTTWLRRSETSESNRRTVIYDGTQTTDFQTGNCMVRYAGRKEPFELVPPHAWCLLPLGVRFRLSVLLRGTEAIQRDAKAHDQPGPGGGVYQFPRVEAEAVGADTVDGRDCIKLRLRRWYGETGDAAEHQVWLARDRNLHCCRAVMLFGPEGKQQVFGDTRVVGWRKLTETIWLPARIEHRELRPTEGQTSAGALTRLLVLEQASLSPNVADVDPKSLPTSSDLPEFTIGLDGTLSESPLQPVPAEAAPDTTLESILSKLATEEQRYRSLRISRKTTYQHLKPEISGGAQFDLTSRYVDDELTLIKGDRLIHERRQHSQAVSGNSHDLVDIFISDGEVVRARQTLKLYGTRSGEQDYAQYWLGKANAVSRISPHTLLFDDHRELPDLAAFLRSEWYDQHNGYRMHVEYSGDERVGDLHCHKLRCAVVVRDRESSYFYLWLARDRNLLMVRREGWSHFKSPKLPTLIAWVEDLHEIQPGMWCPHKATSLAFAQDDMQGGRLAINWRRDAVLDPPVLNPEADDQTFAELTVPAGTKVQVRDADGEFLGQFTQETAGNINVSDEQLLKLRLESAQRKEQAALRLAALDALIGQPAPPLPAETWLNGDPSSWDTLKGKVVLVDFWAVWCGPCVADLKRLAEVQKAWAMNDVKDRVIIGIHTAGSDRESVAKATEQHGITYPVIIDSPPDGTRGSWGRLYDAFAVQAIPQAMIVDADGRVAAHGRLEEMLAKQGELARAANPK